MIKEKINRKIMEWWKKLPDSIRSEKPTFVHEFNDNADVLFMGFNPSGGKKDEITPLSALIDKDVENISEKEKGLIFGSKYPVEVKQYKRYYGIFDVILNEYNKKHTSNLKWEYYDLFHMKERDSKKVFLEIYNNGSELKSTHVEHSELVEEVIAHIKPKIVITNNVNTAKILKSILSLDFDDNLGLYKYQLADNRNPIYFYLNGTMQYGRLVEFEKERIIWYMHKVFNL